MDEQKENDEKRPLDSITQKVYIAASNYIRKNFLKLPLEMKDMKELEIAPAKPAETLSGDMLGIGLTGVPVAYNYNIAISETKRRSSDSNFQWLEINVPKDNTFLNLEKPLSEQSEYVQGKILAQNALGLLFPDEVEEKLKQAYRIAESDEQETRLATVNLNMQTYYDIKRKSVMNLGRGIDYVCYLNHHSRSRDPDQTSAYLYKIGIKGVKYKDSLGDRLLMFNAHDDIIVSQILKSKLDTGVKPAA